MACSWGQTWKLHVINPVQYLFSSTSLDFLFHSIHEALAPQSHTLSTSQVSSSRTSWMLEGGNTFKHRSTLISAYWCILLAGIAVHPNACSTQGGHRRASGPLELASGFQVVILVLGTQPEPFAGATRALKPWAILLAQSGNAFFATVCYILSFMTPYL